MHTSPISIFFNLVKKPNVVKRSIKVALIVGVILNVINQWELLYTLQFGSINYSKFLLTFMVPYMVSSYSSVMAKLNFQVGEIAPLNASLKCSQCEGVVIHVNKGEVIPDCIHDYGHTKWRIIDRGNSNPYRFDNDEVAMALFAEYNPAPVFRFDAQGTVLMSNPAANKIFEKEIEGADIHSLIREFVAYDFNIIIDRGEIKSVVQKIGTQTYHIELRGVPKIGVCMAYGSNITKMLDAQLDNIRLSAAIEQTSNTIIITDIKGDIVFANKAFEVISGYNIAEVLGKNSRFLKTGNVPQETYVDMWKTISGGEVWHGEFNNMKKSGDTYWEEATISPIKDNDGNVINYIAVKEDITEKNAIKIEMKSMAMFAELNPEPVFRFDRKGVITKANPAANKSFNTETIEGVDIVELIPELNKFKLAEFIDNADIEIVEEEIGDYIYRFILRGLPELDMCQIYGSDVTLRRKAEQEVRKQNHHIAQSINYASRIQNAVLPSSNKIAELMPEHFIFFKPRDIVSGDFYWMARENSKLILAAVDCTGHGVPGAFMSMLGVSFLNEIVTESHEVAANEILNKLRVSVKATLAQSGSDNDTKDGMDMALCVIDYDTMVMQYAGAYNPLYLIKDGELIQYKADRMPIGSHIVEKNSFTNHEIQLKKGDVFYLFSDGYIDQFGGKDGRKFSSKAFRNLVLSIHTKSMVEQKEILHDNFNTWRGELNQIDDVLVIGGKI